MDTKPGPCINRPTVHGIVLNAPTSFGGKKNMLKNKKVALLFICLNSPYWPYIKQVIEDCNKYFLTDRTLGHKVDYFLWTDIPEGTNYGATVFPTEPVEWPMPTLMRYHLFLQQEELLKEYDYIFYMDADMRVVDFIDNEILGDGLTAAQHPMYALRHQYWNPYEPNPESAAYIKQPGRLIQNDDGKQMFQPLYLAGGFQGGTSSSFIKAMKAMKKGIDKDFMNNYMARWNDESHWNKYLYDHPPSVVLSPAYIYPDSLLKEYYIPLWGQDYKPKIITLTKPFSTTKEGGMAVQKMLQENAQKYQLACPHCQDVLESTYMITGVLECGGKGSNHKVEFKQ